MKQPRKSNGTYSHNPIDLLNWRIWVIVITIIGILFISNYSNKDEDYVSEQNVFMRPVVVTPDPTIEDKIKEFFPKSYKTVIAIAYAESQMDMDAIGYNCYYNKNKTIVYEKRVKGSHSTFCKKEHRNHAWSVDCFVLQRNYPGRKTCPDGVTLEMHLREAAELSKVQGLRAWSSYNEGKHLAYINN